ncbi:MAG: mechanosensitive ion channel family protein [Ignavibacteriaceae bacterium]
MKLRLSITALLFPIIFLFAQNKPDSSLALKYPVLVSSDTLFYIENNLGPFSAEQRTKAINDRIKKILKDNLYTDSITVTNEDDLSYLVLGSMSVMAVTNKDTSGTGIDREQLAVLYSSELNSAIRKHIEKHSFENLAWNGVIVILLVGLAFALFRLMKLLFPFFYKKIEEWEARKIKPVSIKSYEIISRNDISSLLHLLLKGIRLTISLVIIYFIIIISLSLLPWTEKLNVSPYLKGLFYAVILSTAAYAAVKTMSAFFGILSLKAERWRGTLIQSVRIRNIEILSANRITDSVIFFFKVLKFFLVILVIYFYITILFSFFRFTETWAATLFRYILYPLEGIMLSFVDFLPNLFTIIVIIFVTRYVIKFIRYLFSEVHSGAINIPQFPQEWALPTYKIVRFLVIAFAVIVIFPYLPGSDSEFFKGISIFLGILFSLGSTSAISNIVAGVVITYMRPFRIGDRVKIADTTGDIVEKTLLVTRLRTIKNVDVTIPNAMVLGSHIINFSSSAKERGLILHTTVTIGYDAPWAKVHEVLKSAAAATGKILPEPAPFILQTALNDFHVSYELNAYTDEPGNMAVIYSELHRNIQDKFNEAGIEIMSPNYSAVRDGSRTTIPEDYLPKDYQPPGFKIFPGNIFRKDGE